MMSHLSYYVFQKPYQAIIKARTWAEAIQTYESELAHIETPYESDEEYELERMKMTSSKARVVSEKYAISISGRNHDYSEKETEKLIKEAGPGTIIYYDIYLV